ncbi:transcription termination/antitermination protein NusA [Pseudoflavonifractor sp. SW1122]|uniref:Transcription termination/antitermination protein NusA n=1 Tax=Candidatus Enterenecus faecium TaxID=2840780 RepID=A0A9D0YT65_9FIRM|nr:MULTISPECIES: transcription termination factor NusA [unclassified Pseudoflavonifractor]NJE73683.1 transcription termination/antitermination protein NusA [Pseudoflavonifractor sp. SW1122]OUN94728.1 transcription termination/antitermination protein NusA [Pseudoflavonifractor sp. An44]OUP64498.1 transcription termination/antitermination protein NusA [Pseudoflavonifractor sp. An176]HIQ61781.1 transcription termination/antitermination protein NusA [Candidatus Enterenecus faecium]
MAKKKTAAKSMELDAKEFFAAISDIEKEKGIPKSYMIDKITQALVAAYKRDHAGITDNVIVDANEEKCSVRMFVKKEVVEEVTNPNTEVAIADARRALPRVALGDVLRIEIKPKNFGRIAAQTARQVIVQGMREAERSMIFDAFSAKEHEIISGVVTRVDARNGSVSVRLTSGSEFTDSFLSADEQVPGEVVKEGDRIRVYVVEVRQANRGPQVVISRTHPGLVKRLFELEVPEIYDGTVQVMSISREAGSRTKLAVWSEDENVDAIGACVGPKGQRVNAVVEELRGEKVDIIKYSEDPAEYVAAALAPAEVLSVVELEPGKRCRVVVPDDQLSLAIGKEGQNARLAARLTGLKIDIRPASDPEPAEELMEETAEEPVEVVEDQPEQAEELMGEEE